MTGAAPTLATYDDLLRLGENVRAEVIDGVVVTPPSPLPKHLRAQGQGIKMIGGPYDPSDDETDGPGGWWIFAEADVRLSMHRIVRPDLAGWRRERLVDPADVRPIDVVPDWICEVISPSNAAYDRVTKRRVYAEHQVPYFWLLDPEARTLEALRYDRTTGFWSEIGTYDETDAARIAPFDAIEIKVGRFFMPKPT